MACVTHYCLFSWYTIQLFYFIFFKPPLWQLLLREIFLIVVQEEATWWQFESTLNPQLGLLVKPDDLCAWFFLHSFWETQKLFRAELNDASKVFQINRSQSRPPRQNSSYFRQVAAFSVHISFSRQKETTYLVTRRRQQGAGEFWLKLKSYHPAFSYRFNWVASEQPASLNFHRKKKKSAQNCYQHQEAAFSMMLFTFMWYISTCQSWQVSNVGRQRRRKCSPKFSQHTDDLRRAWGQITDGVLTFSPSRTAGSK